MRSRIVHLDSSPAIPVPQPLLDACQLHNEVEVEARGDCSVIRKLPLARAGWDEGSSRMAASGDDLLLLREALGTRWDEEEWEW